MRLCCYNSLVQSLLRMFLARQSIGFCCWRGFNGLGSTRSSWRLQLRHTVAVFDGDEMESCSCSHFREKMIDRPLFFIYQAGVSHCRSTNVGRSAVLKILWMNTDKQKNCHWIKFASDSNAEKWHWSNRLFAASSVGNPRMKEFAKDSWQDGRPLVLPEATQPLATHQFTTILLTKLS